MTSPSTNTKRSANRIELTMASKKLPTTPLGTVSVAAFDEGPAGEGHGHRDHHHDEGQSDAEALQRRARGGGPRRPSAMAVDQGEEAEHPDQVVQQADCVAGLLELRHLLTVGQDHLAVDTAEVDLADHVEAFGHQARACSWRTASPRLIVSCPLLRSSDFRSPVSTLEITWWARRLAADPDRLERRAGGEPVGRGGDEAVDGAVDRAGQRLQRRRQLRADRGAQVDVLGEGGGQLAGHVLLDLGVVGQRTHRVDVAIGVGDLGVHPPCHYEQRGGDQRHDEEDDRDGEPPPPWPLDGSVTLSVGLTTASVTFPPLLRSF